MKTSKYFLTIALLAAGEAAAQEAEEWSAEQRAKWDLEQALHMWHGGHYGGLLYYHDGGGSLGREWRARLDAKDESAPRPQEWSVTSVSCKSESDCDAIAIVRFAGEDRGRLRRYRLVREPGTFWGLADEQRLECPDGYRLQYQGICLNIADEQSTDPDIEIRAAQPGRRISGSGDMDSAAALS